MTNFEYANMYGEREYKLFLPKGYVNKPLPLIIMLHGCQQDAEDFSLGTGMNVLAEQQNCIVAYPNQPCHASPQKCWNWYRPKHQQRDCGEPSIIAGITLEIMANYKVDVTRVYVAGLSSGGAMAAVMIRTYPDLYAAAGVHSGLAYQSAACQLSALEAMLMGSRAQSGLSGNMEHTPERSLIVFHGGVDRTVHPLNGVQLLQGFDRGNATVLEKVVDQIGGRRSTLSIMKNSNGIDAEHWEVHGASHAWAGGHESGSYTDPKGPNASAEMMRFFLDHSLLPAVA